MRQGRHEQTLELTQRNWFSHTHTPTGSFQRERDIYIYGLNRDCDILWHYLVVQKYGTRGTDNDEGAPGEQSKHGPADTGQDQGFRYSYKEKKSSSCYNLKRF